MLRFPVLPEGVEKLGLPLFSQSHATSKAPLSGLCFNGRHVACKVLSSLTQAFLPSYPLSTKWMFLCNAPGIHTARSGRGYVTAKHDTFMHVFASCSHLELQGSRVDVWSICFMACVASGKASDPGQADIDFLFCFLSPWWVLGFVCLLFPSRGWLKPSGENCILTCFQ